MEQNPKQEEMFPDIASESERDLVTKRRKQNKNVSTILDIRDLAKKIGIKQEMRKEAEKKERIKEILKNK